MKTSDWFFRAGGTAWLIGLGILVVLGVLSMADVVEYRTIEWKKIFILFGVSGLIAMFVGGVLSIWDDHG